MSRRVSTVILAFSALTCVVSSACLATPDGHESVGNAEEGADSRTFCIPTSPPPACAIPAYTIPRYTRPADDSIAFATLIDGAGYAKSAPPPIITFPPPRFPPPYNPYGDSDWTDIASGNVCGGAEKELVLMKNAKGSFSIMRGPVPYPVGIFDALSNTAHPWRGVATLDVDLANDGLDEIVAVRHVTSSGVPELVVMKATPGCDDAKPIDATIIGGPGNSEWVDIAVGNFDGHGKQIVLLKAAHSNFFLVQPRGLTVSYSSDLDTVSGMPWKQVAAGDLDGDGRDELVAARQVGDGMGTTVLVYKWIAGAFQRFATSKFGNTGNSNWTGMTVGDFNGDGHPVIVLQKNEHSNFAMLDLVGNTLQEMPTNDLDSANGQPWRGVTAVDWSSGDQGAQELIAVRAANGNYLTDLFVYGNPFHRAMRDSAMATVRGQWDQHHLDNTENGNASTWIDSIQDSHSNLINILLTRKDDYGALVSVLEKTRNLCVDGKQIRVAVSFPVWAEHNTTPDPDPAKFNCAAPSNSCLTPWNELTDFFAKDATDIARCTDLKEWGRLLGSLAQMYPQLVMVQMDDFTKSEVVPAQIAPEDIAEMLSNIRSKAPWMSFVPTAYYGDFASRPDIARMMDTPIFFFKNDKHGECIAPPCGDTSVANFPGEVAYVESFLPLGRKLQVGFYYDTYFGGKPDPEVGSFEYDFDLTLKALSFTELGGVTAYHMQPKATCPAPAPAPGDTDDVKAARIAAQKYCGLKELYTLSH